MTYGNVLQSRKKMQTQLTGEHARQSVFMLGILHHAMGDHLLNRDLATPSARIILSLLHAPDGWVKRRQRFALVESRNTVLLLPWLMAYTRRGDSRQRDAV